MAQIVIMREQMPKEDYLINENYTKYTNINGEENYANIEKVNNNGHIEIKKNINGNVEYYYEDRTPVFRNDLEYPNVHFDLRKNKEYKNDMVSKTKSFKKNKKGKNSKSKRQEKKKDKKNKKSKNRQSIKKERK
jgi:hypothetical protein